MARNDLFVHRRRSFELDFGLPGPLLRALAALGILASGVLCMFFGFSGLRMLVSPGPHDSGPAETILWCALAALGLILGIVATVAAGELLLKAWGLFQTRAGLFPTLETTGPCRLIQSAGGRWGMRITIEPEGEALTPMALLGTGEGGGPGSTAAARSSSCLFFELDEAAAAELSRVFDPGEPLTLRWLDLPMGLGGPHLLSASAPAREEQAFDEEDRLAEAA